MNEKDLKIINKYDELKNVKLVSEHLHISQTTVRRKLKKYNIPVTRKRRRLNHSIFNNINKDTCYWAGFLAADGNIAKDSPVVSCNLDIKDIDQLNKMLFFVNSDRHISTRYKKQRSGNITKSCSISLYSKQFVKDLYNNFKVIPCKAKIVEPPNLKDSELICSYIRGYFDGDGSLSWHKHNNKPRIEIASGSYKLTLWIKNFLSNNVPGIGNPTILRCKRFGTYKLDYMGYQSLRILSLLYNNSTYNTRLNRKYDSFLNYCDVEQKYLDMKKNKEEGLLERNCKIITLRNLGLSYSQIAEQTDCCITTCYNIINKRDN